MCGYRMALLAALCIHTSIAQAWSLDDLMASLASVGATVVSFSEEKRLAMLEQNLYLSGTLEYRPPDYLKRQVTRPRVETFEVQGDTLIVDTGGEARHLSLPDYPPIQAYVESFRATLGGDRDALENYYQVTLEGSAERWKLSLEPRDKDMASHISRIVVRGRKERIASIETLETDGDRSVLTVGDDR